MTSWAAVAEAGETITCPPAGQEITFLETAEETDGEYIRVRSTLDGGSGRAHAVNHVHPQQTETITVQSGELGVERNGDRLGLTDGDHVTFEPGDAHAYWNAGDGELRIEIKLSPAMQTAQFMRVGFALSQVGKTTRAGIPLNPLRLGLVLDEFDGHLYVTGIPLSLQRLGARILGPIARAVGYSLDLDEGYEQSHET